MSARQARANARGLAANSGQQWQVIIWENQEVATTFHALAIADDVLPNQLSVNESGKQTYKMPGNFLLFLCVCRRGEKQVTAAARIFLDAGASEVQMNKRLAI